MGVTSRSAVRIPSYLLHKPSGQARVRINGRDHYLGPFGSDESRVRYGQLIAQHASGITLAAVNQPVDPFGPNRGSSTTAPESGLTINELVLAFMRFAKQHYRKAGKETSEVHCLKSATRWLVELYGFTPVDQFGPLMLKTVRQKMVDAEWVHTVLRQLLMAGEKARDFLHDNLQDLSVKHVQCDEIWTFTAKKQGRLTADEKDNPLLGDQYLFVAFEQETKLICTYAIGKRTADTTVRFMDDLSRRIKTPLYSDILAGRATRPQISTDGWAAYGRWFYRLRYLSLQ